MKKKKIDFTKYKKYTPILAIIAFIVALDLVGVVDVRGKMADIFTSKAGSKAIDNSEGKNIDALTKPDICPMHYPWGYPRIFDEAVKSRGLYLCSHRFASQYDPLTKVPVWTHEILTKRDLEVPFLTPQLKSPILDNLLPSKMQAKPEEFLGSEYVPGFMASTENMTNDDLTENFDARKKRSEESIAQSFSLSNSIPMNRNLRNNLWLPLDAKIRRMALDYNRIFVITGPIYLGGQTLGLFGENKVAIPTHFYKIVTEPNNHESVAYIIPNKAIRPDGVATDVYLCSGRVCSIDDFVVTIQEIEKLTGMEFYPRLDPYYAVQVKKDLNEIQRKKNLKQMDKANGVIR